MTLKTQKFQNKIWHFVQKKNWENIFIYFQKISARMLRFWSKKGWCYKILEIFKNRSAKTENLGRSRQ